ncbi:hypothetical protein EYZ11_007194 [Aspergillus tanneri]|uniref:Uncharacterized protein n=1 Tax=Aspergillus tanneri TaxID=1220188 RepID=A0A4S3JFY3_9EURO|nr:hypothetical protein EYZ11_007194 [Aspergillus tanneri]
MGWASHEHSGFQDIVHVRKETFNQIYYVKSQSSKHPTFAHAATTPPPNISSSIIGNPLSKSA